MIIARILDPDSKLSLTRKYYHYSLPIKVPESIDVQCFYRSLAYLYNNKESIEKHMIKSLGKYSLNNTTLMFYVWPLGYDLTSSYFEGDNCPIAKYGYSRDHRPDRMQTELGMVIKYQLNKLVLNGSVKSFV